MRRVEGAVTPWVEFKRAFDAYVRYKHPGMKHVLSTDELGPFVKLGYHVIREQLCKGCGTKAGAFCCPSASRANRSLLWRIHDMELVREQLHLQLQPSEWLDVSGE